MRRSEWEWRIRGGCDGRGESVCVRGNVSVCLSVCESVSVSMRIHVSV